MVNVFVFMPLKRLHSKATLRPRLNHHQKCILKSVDIYLFKLSEKLLQAEIQANHIGVCVQTPPTAAMPTSSLLSYTWRIGKG